MPPDDDDGSVGGSASPGEQGGDTIDPDTGGFTGGTGSFSGGDDDDDGGSVGGFDDDAVRDPTLSRAAESPGGDDDPAPAPEPTNRAPENDAPEQFDGQKTRISGPDAPGNPTDQTQVDVIERGGQDGQRVFDRDDDPFVPDDVETLDDELGTFSGRVDADRRRTDEAVERLEADVSRAAGEDIIAGEKDAINITRRGDQLQATLTEEGVRELVGDRQTVAGRPVLVEERQGEATAAPEQLADRDQPSRAPGREPENPPPEEFDGRESLILGEDAARNPTDDTLAIVTDPAGEDGQRVFPADDDPLAPDTPEAAREIGASPAISDQRLNERGLSDTVAGFTTVRGTQADPEIIEGVRGPDGGADADAAQALTRALPEGQAQPDQPPAPDTSGGSTTAFAEPAALAAARAAEGRGGADVIDADAVRDPTLARAEAQARVDARRDELGLSEDDEQFGDIDFSAGLGGPEDEVEQTVDAAPGAVRDTTDRVPNEVLDVGRRGLATTSPVFRGINPAIEAGDRATGGEVSESVNQGLRDAPQAVAEVPGQGLELAELGVFTTDATVAAGGSEEEFDRRIDRVGDAAAGQAELAADSARRDPIRFGTALVASSVAEAGAVGGLARLTGGTAATRRTAAAGSVDAVTPEGGAGGLRRLAADDRGQVDLTATRDRDADESAAVQLDDSSDAASEAQLDLDAAVEGTTDDAVEVGLGTEAETDTGGGGDLIQLDDAARTDVVDVSPRADTLAAGAVAGPQTAIGASDRAVEEAVTLDAAGQADAQRQAGLLAEDTAQQQAQAQQQTEAQAQRQREAQAQQQREAQAQAQTQAQAQQQALAEVQQQREAQVQQQRETQLQQQREAQAETQRQTQRQNARSESRAESRRGLRLDVRTGTRVNTPPGDGDEDDDDERRDRGLGTFAEEFTNPASTPEEFLDEAFGSGGGSR
jgi:hypothetical protein